jgi:hypothetical protein
VSQSSSLPSPRVQRCQVVLPSSPGRSGALALFYSLSFSSSPCPTSLTIPYSLLIGGGASDVSRNPPGRHGHWDNNGEWHEDRSTTRNWHPKTRTAQAMGAAPTADSAIA